MKDIDLKDEETSESCMEDAFAEMAEYESDVSRQYRKALKFYKRNVSFNINELKREDEDACLFHMEEDGFVRHIGYCNVEKVERHGKTCYHLVEEDAERYNMRMYFDKQSECKCGYHELCFQMSNFEDCYNGYMLFPMKDGRYWVVEYEC